MAPKHFAPVWQHYERHEPTGRSKHHRAICKFCGYELSGQPERMKTHLQRCTGCPQEIKDEFATDENSSATNSNGVNHTTFGMPTSVSTEVMDDDAPPPLKRRRSVEVASGAEGLAGLPWAPNANAAAMLPTPAAQTVPPAFQQPYTPTLASMAATISNSIGSAGPSRHESMMGVYDNVRSYYSRISPMNKMQTSIGPTISPHPIIRDAIARVPQAVRDRFYGCGMPLPTGIDGLRVLDLGCGAGRDCYVAAKLVGPTGEVIGLDMTDEQLRVARDYVEDYSRTLGFQPHLRFVKGYIEFLSRDTGLYPGSIDLCISNNAVNLSPNKELVLQSVFDILKEGGEFQFSDIYADRRLPNHVRSHPVLMGECLGGALYTEDFKRLCQRVGFMDARQVSAPAPVRIESPELRDLVGATQFYSITFRLFKFSRPAAVLEPTREDYGQVAIYRGTIEGQRARMRFDNEWAFEAQRPVLVDGNTATMLGESWLRRHFEVRGDRSKHFGGFKAMPPDVQYEPWEVDHEVEEYVATGSQGEALVKRRGILPLPTPFFINGLRQQQQQQQQQQMGMYIGSEFINSQPNSRVSSPVLDHQQSMAPMQQPAVPPPAQRSSPSQIMASIPASNSPSTHRSTLRDHPATFPQLSSFSISQSNVRSESTSGIKARIAAPQASQAALPKRTSSPRFILPVNRVSSGYKPSPPTMASRPPQSAPTNAAPPRFVSQQPEPPSLHTPPVISSAPISPLPANSATTQQPAISPRPSSPAQQPAPATATASI